MSRTRLALVALTIVEAGFVLAGIAAGFGVRAPLWSFDFPRFVETPLAHLLSVGSLVALVLAVRGWPRLASARAGAIALFVLPALLLAAALLLPDRSGFLGDFLLRQGAIAAGGYDHAFPQSLPLDRLLFGHALPAFVAVTGLPLGVAARGIGAAAYLALLAIATAGWRRAGLAPGPAALGVLLVAGTAAASLFTGFARDTVVLLPVLLALAFALAERDAGGRPLSAAPEWLLLVALGLHRTATVMLVPYALATWRARREIRPRAWTIAAVALAAGVLVLVPLDLGVVARFDLSRHTPWLAAGRLGLLPFLHAGHLLDLLAALTLLAPAVLAVALVFAPGAGRAARTLDLALVLPWLPVALLTVPQQGAFRDFDVYAPMATTFAFVGVRQLFRLRTREPGWSVRAARVTAVAGVQCVIAVLLVASNPAATRARVLDAMTRSPAVSTVRRAQWLDWLQGEAARAGDRTAAASFAAHSAEAVPSPVRWVRAGLAAMDAGDAAEARNHFRRLLAIDSTSVLAWCGIAGTSAALSEPAARDEALDRLRRIVREPRRRATAVRFVTSSPGIDPTGAIRAALRDSSARP